MKKIQHNRKKNANYEYGTLAVTNMSKRNEKHEGETENTYSITRQRKS